MVMKNTKTKVTLKGMLQVSWGLSALLGFLIYVMVVVTGLQLQVAQVNADSSLSVRDQIRLDRLITCQEEYKKSEINEQFLYWQIPAVRCATYSTLIMAFESNYGQSRKCIEQKNCHGMKGNGRDHPAWFITFNTYTEWRQWFADRYFKFHYKKNIRTFVHNWSETDQEVYTKFVEDRYWVVYNELETLYINN